jgi:hypothetical protein
LRAQRRHDEWKYVVIIAEKLTEKEAKDLEEESQECCIEKERQYVTYRKYYGPHRDRAYNPGKKSSQPSKKFIQFI